LRQQPGFLGLEVVQTGLDTGVGILWWASEEARMAATPMLMAWVEQHLDPLFVALDNPTGPVVLSSHNGPDARDDTEEVDHATR